jgi:sensor histidine kinase YesM
MMQRRFILLFAAGFWGLFGLVSGIQVWLSMINHGHSVPRLIGYYVLVWEAWFVATVIILALARRLPLFPLRPLPLIVHFVIANVIALLHGLYSLVLMFMLMPYDRMTPQASRQNLERAVFARFSLELALYFFVLAVVMALDFYTRYRERELRAAQLETSLADARLHALELQLQPHFLFNTMNAISALVRNRRNDEAVTMISGLSDLLRYTLDHAGDQHVALEEEVAVLRRYLEIQHVRFPDRMTFRIDLAPDATRAAVPVLLLQPLAENAVRHGIAMSAGPGVIEVRAFRRDGRLRIEVFNSGSISASSDGGSGIGLRNTRARLLHLYGDRGTFELASAHEGVMASVSIPWSEVA